MQLKTVRHIYIVTNKTYIFGQYKLTNKTEKLSKEIKVRTLAKETIVAKNK